MAENKNWKEKWSGKDAVKFLWEESSKRAKGPKALAMSADACLCLLRYKATFHDYMSLRLFARSAKQRESFLTTKMVQAEKKKWDPVVMDKVDDKKKFNELFPELIHREWIDLDEVSFEVFRDFVGRHNDFFLKPKRESSGIGIGRFNASEIKDLPSFYEEKKKLNVLCEESVRMHEKFRELNPQSMSQVRVVTVLGSKGINILATTLRTGGRKDITFNTARNDIFCQVDVNTGKCFTVGVDENSKEFTHHPVSGIEFKGFEIPKFKEMIEV
ncbi:MAG: hypothetical protein IIY75_08935, partial [Erysipelotrichales bacterium]|nr:hypothetical protein [Erysipelotrichales bacterium]